MVACRHQEENESSASQGYKGTERMLVQNSIEGRIVPLIVNKDDYIQAVESLANELSFSFDFSII